MPEDLCGTSSVIAHGKISSTGFYHDFTNLPTNYSMENVGVAVEGWVVFVCVCVCVYVCVCQFLVVE